MSTNYYILTRDKSIIERYGLDYTLTDLPEYITETVRVARTCKDYELNNVVKYYYIELD